MFFTLLSVLSLVYTYGQQSLTDTAAGLNNKTSSKVEIYSLSDKMAEFPGGVRAWMKYLQRNLNYDIPLKNNAPAGRYNVIVMFIINEKGIVSGVKAITNHGYGMEAELIRLLEKGPPWIPAEQKGKAVKSYRKQPVVFLVQNKS